MPRLYGKNKNMYLLISYSPKAVVTCSETNAKNKKDKTSNIKGIKEKNLFSK